MTAEAIQEIAAMQRKIESLEWDMITLLSVANDPEAAKYYPQPDNANAADVLNKIVELHNK